MRVQALLLAFLMSADPAGATVAGGPIDGATVVRDGARLRFGIGVVSGAAGVDRPGDSSQLATILGLELHAGIQLNDWFALMDQASGTLLAPDLRDAVLGEVTLSRYFSMGAGLGIDWLPLTARDVPSLSAGVPVRVAVNFPTATDEPAARHAVALSLELTTGVYVGRASSASAGPLLGVLLGISYEIY